MKVGLASADWSTSVVDANGHPVWGGSGWARLGQYAGKLPHDVVFGTLVSKGDIMGVRTWTGEDHFDCDVIVMQRYMFAAVADIMKRQKGRGQVIINDVDDWYWGLRPSNNAWLLSHPKVNAEENVNHYSTVVANSTALMVSTPYLGERLRTKCSCPIELVENVIDLDRFTPRQHKEGTPIVGWVGSTSHRSGDLEMLRGILPAVGREGFQFHHSGDNEGAVKFSDVVGVPATTLPLVAPEKYPDSFVFDIGLVPLSDNPFNRAKSWIKGLEYAAAGVPFVAPAFGEYKRLHDTYGIGRIAKKPQDWKKHILALRDPDVRQAEAESNREKVAALDIAVGVRQMNEVLETYASQVE